MLTPPFMPPLLTLPRYTHLPSVLRGLSELVGRVLGITLDMAPAPPGEAWAAGVIRCEASHPDLGFLGTVYLDLCRWGCAWCGCLV